jgi:hypothetical protein
MGMGAMLDVRLAHLFELLPMLRLLFAAPRIFDFLRRPVQTQLLHTYASLLGACTSAAPSPLVQAVTRAAFRELRHLLGAGVAGGLAVAGTSAVTRFRQEVGSAAIG